jgi:hypothetical protein
VESCRACLRLSKRWNMERCSGPGSGMVPHFLGWIGPLIELPAGPGDRFGRCVSCARETFPELGGNESRRRR